FTKEEVAAFSTAMQFSKEFASKLQEMLGQNTMSKDLKQAFTLMNQEMAAMDEKDRKLVKAVGKAFAEAVGEKVKETSAAKDIEQAVDLKPRVADGESEKAMVREDLKDAMTDRRESMSEAAARKTSQNKTLPQKAEVQAETGDNRAETDSDKTWKEFFGKLRDDAAQTTRQVQTRAENADTLLRSATNDITAKTQNQTAEKVDAPKVMRQVEDAFIKTLNNGVKQLTVQLSPENLGKLTVALQVNGKEVSATIRAESAEAAKVIQDHLEIIKTALENQGLKVDKLEVQAGLTGNQDGNNWFGQEQHNLARESEIMAAMRNHIRSMRGDAAAIQDTAQAMLRPTHTDGLHIVA
ncbi:MAG: flagellar hook-length control protein FliK, partial [Pseudodesulfovibrio sp.]